ncbi:hypothetical protein OR16_14974 [Cupriavidus basilensis OR16]|uniref:Uncharacterized protein n=1 Tax=Cupriavidus basilensis OR16 TaxID=1127483 RepID=H1S587_9BURK|nr:hypothetical protein [Cupriavidus basilensis]EHP42254.1 hypothetical protein OR16_14974 [Cupriavidus basilensis OR16]
MAKHLFSQFPEDEQREVAAVCSRLGFVPDDFEITDEGFQPDDGDPAQRQVSVRRPATDAQCAYDASEGPGWIGEFESDLECGLFGKSSGRAPA